MVLVQLWTTSCRSFKPQSNQGVIWRLLSSRASRELANLDWKESKGRQGVSIKKLCRGRSRKIAAVVERLKALSHQHRTITPSRFMQICCDVSGRRHGAKLAEVCYSTGAVMRHGQRIYTGSDDIQFTLNQRFALPSPQLESLLKKARAELSVLQARKDELDRMAYLPIRRWFHVGWVALVFQLLFYMRLTFVELSWDIMEPAAYFTTNAISLALFGYFVLTMTRPKLSDMQSSIVMSRKEILYRRAEFPLERYEVLLRRVKFYERFVTGLK